MNREIIDYFKKVEAFDSVDVVIQQLRDLIHPGILKPEDRLPSEKKIESNSNHDAEQMSEIEIYRPSA